MLTGCLLTYVVVDGVGELRRGRWQHGLRVDPLGQSYPQVEAAIWAGCG